jgi:hypothetical protein
LRHVQQIERLGQALAGAAMLSLAKGQPEAARRLLCRAKAVHTTPAVRALAKLSQLRRNPETELQGEDCDR